MKKLILLASALALSTPLLAQQTAYTAPKNDKIPPADPYVADALKGSPRHGEWIDVKMADGKMMKSWITYPARADKAPVVIVIFEIFGLSDWVRGVTDQLAQDGFIAIAPDLVWGKAPNGGGSDEFGTNVRQPISAMDPAERVARLNAVLAMARPSHRRMAKPAALGSAGVEVRAFCTPSVNRTFKPLSCTTAPRQRCRARRRSISVVCPRSRRRCWRCIRAPTTARWPRRSQSAPR
jgi:carboxymethylenebutenolidase